MTQSQYIGRDGRIHQGRPWDIYRLVELFWGIINFFVLFFKTLTEPILGGLRSGLESNRRGGGGGGGGGGSGPGQGPGGPQNRRMGRIMTMEECTVPGGG